MKKFSKKKNLLKKLGRKKVIFRRCRAGRLERTVEIGLTPLDNPPARFAGHLVLRGMIAGIFPSKRGVN